MDGRRFRRWVACGGLAAALVGCHRNNVYPDAVGPDKGQAVGPMTPGKSIWGKSTPPKTDAPPVVPGVPGSPTTSAPVSSGKKKKELSPESRLAFADSWVAMACSDPPPPNRDALLDQARQTYERILKKDPKNGPATLGMARLCARTGQKELALERYRAYLKAHPGEHAVMSEIAATHARWKDMNGAVAWYDEALKADPQNRTYRKSKGFCLALAGRWDEGLASLTQLMPEAEARFYMAQMLADLNHLEHSRQQLTAALQLNPNFAPAREFLAALDQAGRPQPSPAEANPVMQAGYTP